MTGHTGVADSLTLRGCREVVGTRLRPQSASLAHLLAEPRSPVRTVEPRTALELPVGAP
jgi:hypothetical protein